MHTFYKFNINAHTISKIVGSLATKKKLDAESGDNLYLMKISFDVMWNTETAQNSNGTN